MPFNIFGSRSNTPNESIQESNSNTAGGYTGHGMTTGRIDSAIVAEISKILKAGGQIKVVHRYRHFTKDPGLLDNHHSQIFIKNASGGDLFNFGLWSGDGDKVYFSDDSPKYYKDSTTYDPNPVTVTPQVFLNAFLAVRRKCGPDYKLLHNNCQKFARLLMEELGSTHKRRFFFL